MKSFYWLLAESLVEKKKNAGQIDSVFIEHHWWCANRFQELPTKRENNTHEGNSVSDFKILFNIYIFFFYFFSHHRPPDFTSPGAPALRIKTPRFSNDVSLFLCLHTVPVSHTARWSRQGALGYETASEQDRMEDKNKITIIIFPPSGLLFSLRNRQKTPSFFSPFPFTFILSAAVPEKGGTRKSSVSEHLEEIGTCPNDSRFLWGIHFFRCFFFSSTC